LEAHDAGDGGAVNRRRKQARGGGARDAFLVDNAQNELPDSHSPPANPVYVLFDRPSGKGNLGALLRSCDAFGVNKLYCAGHSVDIYDPEVIASSTGSFFTVPFELLSKADEIDKLIDGLRREHPGLLVAGTSAHAAQSAYDADLGGPLLLLIGNESDGLSWRLKHLADALISIPMSPVSYATSLNVSCAATALLYEAFRRRRGANP